MAILKQNGAGASVCRLYAEERLKAEIAKDIIANKQDICFY
jgi:hypothetical protein